MRFRFNSLSRPLDLTRRLQWAFPALGHSRSMDWAAWVYGYRDWDELLASTGSHQEVTAELRYRVGPEGKALFHEAREEAVIRKQTFEHRLLKLVGRTLPGWESLSDMLWPASDHDLPYLRLGTTGDGHAFFAGFAFDLMTENDDLDSAGDDDGRGIDYFSGLPQGFTEEQMLTKAKSFVGSGRETGLEGSEGQTALDCLANGPFNRSALQLLKGSADGGHVATQTRSIRYWSMRGQDLAGFAVMSITSTAHQAGNRARVEIDVKCAGGTYVQREFAQSSVEMLAWDAAAVVERLTWLRVGCPEPAPIDVQIRASTLAAAGVKLLSALPSALRVVLGEGRVDLDGIAFTMSAL